MYYCYLVRCSDNSLYCGITNNLKKRVADHNKVSKTGAKYTYSRRPVMLVYYEQCFSRQMALKREIEIKKFTKTQKEALICKIRSSPDIKVFE